jgi:hypothetical protein
VAQAEAEAQAEALGDLLTLELAESVAQALGVLVLVPLLLALLLAEGDLEEVVEGVCVTLGVALPLPQAEAEGDLVAVEVRVDVWLTLVLVLSEPPAPPCSSRLKPAVGLTLPEGVLDTGGLLLGEPLGLGERVVEALRDTEEVVEGEPLTRALLLALMETEGERLPAPREADTEGVVEAQPLRVPDTEGEREGAGEPEARALGVPPPPAGPLLAV